MRIAIYSRKSKYTGKGESIENQVSMCKNYVLTNIIGACDKDIYIYEDEGYSAKNLDRPKFKQLLEDSVKKPFDYIVCYRLDRISRNVSDFSALIESLNKKNISLICIKEQFDTSTPMGRAMMYIASVFAQLERETIAERVRDNMLMLSKTGRWLGGTTPTGFTSEKVSEMIIDGKNKYIYKLKFNPDEIKIVKIIYNKFMEVKSVAGVCKFLITNQIKSRNGNFFSNLGIKDILTNPVYCIADEDAFNYFTEMNSDVCFEEFSEKYGILAYNKRSYTKKGSPRNDKSQWIVATGKHKGIISGKEWVYVQNNLARKPLHDTRNNYSLLSGLIICQKCGSRMFAKLRNNNNNLFDYICGNKLRGGNSLCSCKNLNGKETDQIVYEYILNSIEEDTKIFDLLVALKKRANQLNPLIEIQNRIDRYNNQINNLTFALSQPYISPSLFEHINNKATELEFKINMLNSEKLQLSNAISEIKINELSNFKDLFSKLNTAEKREIIKLIVNHIDWDDNNLNIFLFK